MNTKIAIATVIGCVVTFPLIGLGPQPVGSAATMQRGKPPKGSTTELVTVSKLPSLGSNAEAHGVNEAGTVVVGHSFDRAGLLYAVMWTMQNGSWVIAKLPYPGKAAQANGVDNHGDAVGWVGSFPRYPAFWPGAGGYSPLGCANEVGEAHALSADGQVVVGQSGRHAVAWPLASNCTEYLPPLVEGAFAAATAVNGDGGIIGGRAGRVSSGASLPVRWTGPAGARLIEELDSRPGDVRGANGAGDLAGSVIVACALEAGCRRAVIWYAGGHSSQLATLGGADSWARDINAAGEVVGISTSEQGTNTAFFWSLSTGMFRLPDNRYAVANAVSDVRSDGTRLVAGMDGQANAAVWLVRNP
jgi:probable HAF family extracellular repeat protein